MWTPDRKWGRQTGKKKSKTFSKMGTPDRKLRRAKTKIGEIKAARRRH